MPAGIKQPGGKLLKMMNSTELGLDSTKDGDAQVCAGLDNRKGERGLCQKWCGALHILIG